MRSIALACGLLLGMATAAMAQGHVRGFTRWGCSIDLPLGAYERPPAEGAAALL